MTVGELAEKLGLEIMSCGSRALNTAVTGVYSCDLISHAMAKLNPGNVWITVHTNLNVAAVASLAEASCVLVPENIEISGQTLERAEEKEVIFLSGGKSAARFCYEILSLLESPS
ncbi:MAG TPA: hypothetical protein DD738_09780 [Ruminiclostridium sp.]|jgi:hypothetical protein|nr:hypothetical protein [Ruminiclostridium sp.]